MNLTPSDSVLQCPTTEPQRLYSEQGPMWSSYVTHILQTAGISNVLSIMFINRIWKMVTFEPQTFMATPKFFFISCSWQNKKHFSLSIILLVWCVFSKDKTIRSHSTHTSSHHKLPPSIFLDSELICPHYWRVEMLSVHPTDLTGENEVAKPAT